MTPLRILTVIVSSSMNVPAGRPQFSLQGGGGGGQLSPVQPSRPPLPICPSAISVPEKKASASATFAKLTIVLVSVFFWFS